MGQDEIKNFVQMKNEDFQRKKESGKVLEEISSKNIFFFLPVTVKHWTELWIELAKKKKLEQTPLLTWLDGQDTKVRVRGTASYMTWSYRGCGR